MEYYSIVLIRLVVAMLLGALVGAERTFAGKVAGMRTFGLVAMGAALFVTTSEYAGFAFSAVVDPMRMGAAIVTGIGFLGAGLIFFQQEEHRLNGLTTAAGLWVVCGIGIAVGLDMFAIAAFATVITIVTFTIMWFIEEKIRKISKRNGHEDILS